MNSGDKCTEELKTRRKESIKSTGKNSPDREITDDFVVDVSSPCKIVSWLGLKYMDFKAIFDVF